MMFEGSARQECPADALGGHCHQRPAGSPAVGEATENHSQSEAETLPGIPEEQTYTGPSSILGAVVRQGVVGRSWEEARSAPQQAPSGFEDSISGDADDTGGSWYAGRGLVGHSWEEAKNAPRQAPSGFEDSIFGAADDTGGSWHAGRGRRLWQANAPGPLENSQGVRSASAAGVWQDAPSAPLASQLDSRFARMTVSKNSDFA